MPTTACHSMFCFGNGESDASVETPHGVPRRAYLGSRRVRIWVLRLGELLVPEAVRLVGLGAETALAVGFVGFVVPFEVLDVGVAFEGQDVGGDAVEEP